MKKEFYRTREEALEAANKAAGANGIVDTNTCDASGFDHITTDAINDALDGTCLAFWSYDEHGELVGVFAFLDEDEYNLFLLCPDVYADNLKRERK